MEDLDLLSIAEARSLLASASSAAPVLASLSQQAIDSILDAMHQAAVPRAEEWARLAHEETGFGNVADKTAKNLFAAVDVHRFIRPMKTVGILKEDHERRLFEIAAPAGIIAAIVPSTNPTSTAVNKIFISLKAACPIVVSPHPNARRCVIEVCRVLSEAASAAGAPPGSIGCMTHVALEGTRELMRHPRTAIILATGGTGLVRAAYSSGKPAYGVGPGNVPAYVDRSADLSKAARDIVAGKTFDNGVLCSAENAVVADAPIAAALEAAMTAEGCRFLDARETEALSRLAVTPAGALNTGIVGRDAVVIAGMAGIAVPKTTRCLVAKLDAVGPKTPLSREKLSPILAFYVEDGWEAACARCLEILAYGGMGHTMSIHASDREVIMRFAMTKPVFRIVVNSLAAIGAVGITTGVDPSMTLGCGALGGNITSDNITPRHLVNVKRLAFETRPHTPRWVSGGASTGTSPVSSGVQPAGGSQPAAAAFRAGASPVEAASTSPASRSAGPEASLRSKIESALERRGLLHGSAADRGTAGGGAAAPEPPTTNRSASPAPSAVPTPTAFVSEADVRRAMKESRKIVVPPRTIITPSARDLGSAHRVFVET